MTRLCFIATIVVGAIMLTMGLFLFPTLPHFQLDRVLTPAELADDEVRAATLALLERAKGNQWLVWSIFGLIQVAIGLAGLLAEKRRHGSG